MFKRTEKTSTKPKDEVSFETWQQDLPDLLLSLPIASYASLEKNRSFQIDVKEGRSKKVKENRLNNKKKLMSAEFTGFSAFPYK